jgi:CubicO group peptidase (beta-lactamase class C family)
MGRIEDLLQTAIAEGVFPGACYAYGKLDGRGVSGSIGRYTYCPDSPAVSADTIWDLASVSKVVGTTTMAMLMFDKGLLKLDETVGTQLPAFAKAGKERLAMKNLLVHDSGLIAFRPYQKTCTTPEQVWDAICVEPLTYPTGTKMVYSDLNMITLQMVLEHVAGEPMEVFLKRNVWTPLGMEDTQYNPGLGNPRCAPTEGVEPWRATLRQLRKTASHAPSVEQFPDAAHWVQGEVHDPNAAVCGGVAGHAGLFSTASDLARFATMMLKGGETMIKPETIRLFTKRQSESSSRALGWDTKSAERSSAGAKLGPRSYGHTGYTGTSIWIDPDAKVYSILLTNRVHPTSENTKIIQFRPKFQDAVADELGVLL